MLKPTEKQIETYVRFPSELTDAEKVWIRDAIRQNRELQLLADWYKTFYETVDQIDRDLIKTPPPAFIITLSPLQRSATSYSAFTLSADSPESSQSSRLKTLQTFASEEHKTLVIALEDKKKNRSQLHVISGYINEDDILLLKTGDQKEKILVSDPGGIFIIDEQDIPSSQIAEWPSFDLHLPVTSIKMFRDPNTGSVTFDTFANDRQNRSVHLDVKDSSLHVHVTVDAPDQPVPTKCLTRSGETTKLLPMTGGRCTIDLERLEEVRSDLFFFL